MQHDTGIYLFLRQPTVFFGVTHWILTLFTLQTQLYSFLTCKGRGLSVRGLQTIVFLGFHISCCSSLCQKTVRWYLGNCRLRGRAPDSTRAPRVSRGRHVMMCQPASHHNGLPARRRSLAKSVHIMDRMTNGNLSQMQSLLLDTIGGRIFVTFSLIKPSNLKFY